MTKQITECYCDQCGKKIDDIHKNISIYASGYDVSGIVVVRGAIESTLDTEDKDFCSYRCLIRCLTTEILSMEDE